MTTLLKLNVFKTSDFRGDVDMQSLLNVGKKATFSEELEVVGASILKDTLSVAENATLAKDLSVAGASTLSGAASCGSTLEVQGWATMKERLIAEKHMTVGQGLYVEGLGKFKNDLTADGIATFGSEMLVAGASTLSGAVDMSSTLAVAGATTINSTLNVDLHATVGQSLSVTGMTNLGWKLDVADDASFSKDIAVAGASTLSGAASCESTLAVAGAATMSDTLNVAGVSSLEGVVLMSGGDASTAGLSVLNKALLVDTDIRGDFKYIVNGESKLHMINDTFKSKLANNFFRYGTAQDSLLIDGGDRAKGVTPIDRVEITKSGLKIRRNILPNGNLVEADRSQSGSEHFTLFGAPTKQSAVVTTDAISLFKEDGNSTVAEFTPDSIAFNAPLSAQKISCVNLDVAGTMTTKHQEEVFIGDSHMVLNAGSETTGQMHGGLVTVYDVSHALAQKGVNFTDATSCTTTSTEQDFKDAALPGMILQISGSAENDGLYLIESNIGGSIKCFAAFDGIGEKMPFIKLAAFTSNLPNAHDQGTMLSLVSVNSLLVHGGGGHSTSEEVSGHGAHGSGLMYMCSGGHRDDFFLDGEAAPSKAWKYQRIGADRTYENKTNSLDIYADVTNLNFATDADIPALTNANAGTQVTMKDSGKLDFPDDVMDRSNNRLVWLPAHAKAGTSYKISSSADDTVYITSSDFVDMRGNNNILTGINDGGDDDPEKWTNNITLEQYGSICITKTQPGVWQVL